MKLTSKKSDASNMTLRAILSFFFFVFLLPGYTLATENEERPYQIEAITNDLTHPWGMAFLPNGDLLISQRVGRLTQLSFSTYKTSNIEGLPAIHVGGQGGLMDVAIDPEFDKNRWVYFSYVAVQADGKSTTTVARAKLGENTLSQLEIIFQAQPSFKNNYHFGSRLAFSDANTLFISLGERYSLKNEAQSLENHHGTIVRIYKDGRIPADNPFVNKPKARPEIYSYGHRNVQGLYFDKDSGVLWSHEHGPKGGDELNMIKAGANYGWPVITYGVDYSGAIISELTEKTGLEQPVTYWVPSIAPSGMAVYKGDAFPEWQGDLLIGALSHRHLRRLSLKNNAVVEQTELLGKRNKRIRDVEVGPDGLIYVLTDEARGELLRLSPAEN